MAHRFRRKFAWIGPVLLLFSGPSQALEIPLAGGKIDAEGKIEFLDVERVEPSSPRQYPQGKIQLRLGTDLSSHLRFQSAMTALAGGTPRNTRRGGVFNFDDTLQDISPSFEGDEAYFDFYFPRLDARIGLQKFAWGKLDGIQPNDLLNPEKFYDPLLQDEDDRKVGVPAFAPTVYLPPIPSSWAPTDLRLTAVWVPVVIPFHFPDQDERWYPPIARVPAETESMGFTVHNRSRILNGNLPARTNLKNGAGAARLAGLFQGADFALYYYDGFDTSPAFDIDPRAFVRYRLEQVGCVPDPQTRPECFDVRSEIDLFPVFRRIRSAGADLAYNFLGATIRAEGAFIQDRLYPRSIRDIVASQEVDQGSIDLVTLLTGQEQEVGITLAPVNARRDAVEWGFGGDYLYRETFILLQVNQTALVHNDVDLLISDYETRIAMTIRRSFLDDKLQAELIGFYGMQGVYGFAHPRITYDLTDWLDVRVGYLLIEGHESSILGQYKHDDEGYVRVRFTF
jgi:hypothetical protein